MRIRAGTTVLLAAALALAPSRAPGQSSNTHVSLSLGFGSVWDGFRFDLARYDVGPGHGSAARVSLGTDGLAVGVAASSGYGFHRGGLNRWTRPARHHYYAPPPCWDVWYAPEYGYHPVDFYYSDLYYDCFLLGPRWAFEPDWRHRRYRSPWHPRGGLYVGIHWGDPFGSFWGPCRAWDPCGWYRQGWRDGFAYGRGWGWHDPYAWYPYPTAHVAVWGSPGRTVVARPSPFHPSARRQAGFKEDPWRGAERVGASSRVAPSSAPLRGTGERGVAPPRSPTDRRGVSAPSRPGGRAGVAAPSRPSARSGVTAPSRPSARSGVTAPSRPSARSGVTAPSRPTDRAGVTAPSRPSARGGVTAPSRPTDRGVVSSSPRPSPRSGLAAPSRPTGRSGLSAPRSRPSRDVGPSRSPSSAPDRPSVRAPERIRGAPPSVRPSPSRAGGAPSARGSRPAPGGRAPAAAPPSARSPNRAPSARSVPPGSRGGPPAARGPARSGGRAPAAGRAPSRSGGGPAARPAPSRARGGSGAAASRPVRSRRGGGGG